jgi:hypothetical protein
MNDADVLDQLRDALADVRMEIPLEAIVARGQHTRRRRHLRMLAAAGVAASVVVAGAVSLGHPGSPPAPPDPATAQLAAFTVASTPGGVTALTLRKGEQYRLDPGALRQALAAHGIPAVVTVGEICDTSPEPDGLDQVLSARKDANGAVYLTINPAALPAGVELSIGYYPTGTSFALVEAGAPLRCSRGAPGGGRPVIRPLGARPTPAS